MSENARSSTWVTWVLIALNVAMFVVEIAMGADPLQPTPQQILRLGGDFSALTLHGEWWRVATSMFLHYGIIHIAMNMIVLAQGRVVELEYGHLGFFAIYLISGLLGGVGSVAHNGAAVSAGASGAVFGVFGAFGALLVLRRRAIDPAVWSHTARQLGIFVIVNLAIGLQSSTIDITAHIVGLITGFAIGALLLVGKTADHQRVRRGLAALVLGIAVTAIGLAVVPEPARLPIVTLIEKLDAVEKQCLATYNDRVTDTRSGTLGELGFADAIEREVLPPWHAMRVELDAFDTSHLKPKLQQRLELSRLYMKAREEAWQQLVASIRQPTPEAKTQYQQLEAQVRDLIQQISALDKAP